MTSQLAFPLPFPAPACGDTEPCPELGVTLVCDRAADHYGVHDDSRHGVAWIARMHVKTEEQAARTRGGRRGSPAPVPAPEACKSAASSAASAGGTTHPLADLSHVPTRTRATSRTSRRGPRGSVTHFFFFGGGRSACGRDAAQRSLFAAEPTCGLCARVCRRWIEKHTEVTT